MAGADGRVLFRFIAKDQTDEFTVTMTSLNEKVLFHLGQHDTSKCSIKLSIGKFLTQLRAVTISPPFTRRKKKYKRLK